MDLFDMDDLSGIGIGGRSLRSGARESREKRGGAATGEAHQALQGELVAHQLGKKNRRKLQGVTSQALVKETVLLHGVRGVAWQGHGYVRHRTLRGVAVY
jgi:hypothetical protein